MENKLIYLPEAFQGIKQKRHWSPFLLLHLRFHKRLSIKNALEIVSTEDLVEISAIVIYWLGFPVQWFPDLTIFWSVCLSMGWIGGVRVNEEPATQIHDGGGRKLPTKSSCCPVSSSLKVNSQHTVNALMGKFCALSIAWSLYTFMCYRAGGPTQSPVRSGLRVTDAAPDSKYQRFVPNSQ